MLQALPLTWPHLQNDHKVARGQKKTRRPWHKQKKHHHYPLCHEKYGGNHFGENCQHSGLKYDGPIFHA
jgi:hypothetical protein